MASLVFRAVAYLLAIIAAEDFTNEINPVVGLILHTTIFFVAIVDAATSTDNLRGALLLTLALAPLVRILSLILPLANISQIWWYPAIYVPLITAATAAAVVLKYRASEIGLTLKGWGWQILLTPVGLGLGYLEYQILQPEPIVSELTWQAVWLPALILIVCTGFGEEFIFRGLMQKSAIDAMGTWGIIYISLVFAALHLGWVLSPDAGPIAWLDIAFVFVVASVFGLIVKKSGSLLGVALVHGMTNVTLFILAPLMVG